LFHRCCTIVTLLLHCCYTIVALLLFFSHTVVTLFVHSSYTIGTDRRHPGREPISPTRTFSRSVLQWCCIGVTSVLHLCSRCVVVVYFGDTMMIHIHPPNPL
jgi:hypothetical protein